MLVILWFFFIVAVAAEKAFSLLRNIHRFDGYIMTNWINTQTVFANKQMRRV
jgi:hypothetical protein